MKNRNETYSKSKQMISYIYECYTYCVFSINQSDADYITHVENFSKQIPLVHFLYENKTTWPILYFVWHVFFMNYHSVWCVFRALSLLGMGDVTSSEKNSNLLTTKDYRLTVNSRGKCDILMFNSSVQWQFIIVLRFSMPSRNCVIIVPRQASV